LFDSCQSASRRRAGAALWRAAKAEGLAHSKTLRAHQAAPNFRQVLDCGPPPLFQQGKKVTGGFNYSWPFVKKSVFILLRSIASEDRSVVKFFP
jgi:hypothetical protein